MKKRAVRLLYKGAIPVLITWFVLVLMDRYVWDEAFWIPIFIAGAVLLLALILFLFLGPDKTAPVYTITDTASMPDSMTYGKEDTP